MYTYIHIIRGLQDLAPRGNGEAITIQDRKFQKVHIRFFQRSSTFENRALKVWALRAIDLFSRLVARNKKFCFRWHHLKSIVVIIFGRYVLYNTQLWWLVWKPIEGPVCAVVTGKAQPFLKYCTLATVLLFLAKGNENDNRKQHRDLPSYQFFHQRTVTVKVSKIGDENREALKLGRFANYCMYPNHDSSGTYLHTDSVALDFLFLATCKKGCKTVSRSLRPQK